MHQVAGSVAMPSVGEGCLLALRLFDVAYAIDLDQMAEAWRRAGGRPARRAQLSARAPRRVIWNAPPLELDLGEAELGIGADRAILAARARVYAFGVVTLVLDWMQIDLAWGDLVDRLHALDQAVDGAPGIALWRQLLERVLKALPTPRQRPQAPRIEEDYLIALIRRWRDPITSSELLQRVDLAPLLSGERDALSEETRRELLRHRHSYFRDDLVALTWDRALIIEPRGDADALDMIEQANAQLLELRWYDAVLNEELPRMALLVEGTRRPFRALVPWHVARLARRLHAQIAEVNELIEKVDGTLQLTGDTWLARVHASARDALGVPGMAKALERKLALMRETYRALYDEATSLRATVLEVTIVALIALEIVLAITTR